MAHLTHALEQAQEAARAFRRSPGPDRLQALLWALDALVAAVASEADSDTHEQWEPPADDMPTE
jgi:hypothetical protein